MFWTSPAPPVSRGSSYHCRQQDPGGFCPPSFCRTDGSIQNFHSFQSTVVLSPIIQQLLDGFEKGASLVLTFLSKYFKPYQRISTILLRHWSLLLKSLGHYSSDGSLLCPVLLLFPTWKVKRLQQGRWSLQYKNLRMCVGMLRSLITSAFVPTTSRGIWT